MACEEQLGPLSQPCLQKKDDIFRTNVRNSSLRRVDHFLSWEGGSRVTERQKDRRVAVLALSSKHTQGKDGLINRKNLEHSSGNPVPDDLKCSTQALQGPTLGVKWCVILLGARVKSTSLVQRTKIQDIILSRGSNY